MDDEVAGCSVEHAHDFVSIGAALLARACGARRPGARLAGSAAVGAGLLWLADGAVALVEPLVGGSLGTGSATALVGVPLLLAAASLVRLPAPLNEGDRLMRCTMASRPILTALAVGLVVALANASMIGRDAGGLGGRPQGCPRAGLVALLLGLDRQPPHCSPRRKPL